MTTRQGTPPTPHPGDVIDPELGCVLDASVILRWWFGDEREPATSAARQLHQAIAARRLTVHVPDLAFAECANGFWKAVRFNNWAPAAARQAVLDLRDSGLISHSLSGLSAEALDVAVAFQVTVYDSLYAVLARRLSLPLYTADRRLAGRLAGKIPAIYDLSR